VDDPPRLLVSDATAGLAPTLPPRLVVLLDRYRTFRHGPQREVGEVLAHRVQGVLRVAERREERLAGPAQELDVLPRVRRLISLEKFSDADLPLGVAGVGVRHHVPHALARVAG